jgi:hypothetical protein
VSGQEFQAKVTASTSAATQRFGKRRLIHAGGFELGLLMRQLIGVGAPRGLEGVRSRRRRALQTLIQTLRGGRVSSVGVRLFSRGDSLSIAIDRIAQIGLRELAFATGANA